MGGGRMAAAAGGARARRPLGPASGVLIAALVVALLPAIPITARALLAATHGLTVVLQAEDDFWYGTFIVAIGLPRVLASLWIYYRAWNEWANGPLREQKQRNPEHDDCPDGERCGCARVRGSHRVGRDHRHDAHGDHGQEER